MIVLLLIAKAAATNNSENLDSFHSLLLRKLENSRKGMVLGVGVGSRQDQGATCVSGEKGHGY